MASKGGKKEKRTRENRPLIAMVPLTALIVGARAGLLRDGRNIGPQLA